MAKRKCIDCGYIYDEKVEKVKFKKLPRTWKCPKCGAPKVKVEEMHILPKMGLLFVIFFVICFVMYNHFNNIKPTEYDFYITDNDTSMLYSLMYAVDNNNSGYFYSTGNFNKDKLGENIVVSDASDINGVVEDIKGAIKSEISSNNKVYFHLYVSDDLTWVEYLTLNLYNVNYDVTYLSGGVKSYEKKYMYSYNNSYDEFREYSSALDKVLDDNIVDDSVIKDNNFILVSAMRDNVNYVIGYPEFINSEDVLVNMEYKNINFTKEKLSDRFISLDAIEQNKLLGIIGIDRGALDREYFNDAEKDYLIVTGAEFTDLEEFTDYFKSIVDEYSVKYHVLYLDNYGLDEEYINVLDTIDVRVLPNIDFSVFEMIYPKYYVGGYLNDDYIEVRVEKVLFRSGEYNTYPIFNMYNILGVK